MTKKDKIIVSAAVLAVVAALVATVLFSIRDRASESSDGTLVSGQKAGKVEKPKAKHAPKASKSKDEVVVESEPDSEENDTQVAELTEEEKQEAEEARLVDVFDAETDKWMDSEKTAMPTMDEINDFRDKFRALPENRKDECLHRALNLLPDENIMLLVGILMDKTENKEYVELIYNDVLNRDESVKNPILMQIYRDKEHPCWADTAWIFDVTGENKKN